MKRFHFLIYGCLIGALWLLQACKSGSSIQSEGGYQVLFTNNSQHWSPFGDAQWDWGDGVLTGGSGAGYMVSREQYDDFILEVEFMPDNDINSGIFIRCPEAEFSPRICYEINIWDNHDNQDFRTGSIVTYGKPLAYVNTVGKWNLYRIIAKGDQITVWLNDIKTAELTDPTAKMGTIALQANGQGTIKFRNVRVKPL